MSNFLIIACFEIAVSYYCVKHLKIEAMSFYFIIGFIGIILDRFLNWIYPQGK